MLVAAIQITAKQNKKKNLAVAKDLMVRAARQGAELITLPEFFSFIGSKSEMAKNAEKFKEGPSYEMCSEFAKENDVYVLAGSIPTIPDKGDKKLFYNKSILFGPDGKILAYYNKLHLFATEIADSASYSESSTFRPGSEIVVVDTPFGKVGFSICYDLRFPELFRAMTMMGARIIFVPSAFTMYTGKDHWLALLKARAIENQVYIVAPAQYGRHSEQKVSFGKSCIIDPWGNILAVASDCETVVVADIDFKFLNKVRKELPVLKHYREDLFRLF